MSDQEMQFFSQENQDSAPSQSWSLEQDSSTPVPISRADRQSLDRVWGRLEEHVSRNRAYYQYNRNLPALPILNEGEGEKIRQPVRSHRVVFWKRLDALAAAVFLMLLMGSLFTFVYRLSERTQLAAGPDLSSEAAICGSTKNQTQNVTIIEGKNGPEVLPHKIILRSGTRLVWINQTASGQLVLNANTGGITMKLAQYEKAITDPLTDSQPYSFSVQAVSQSPVEKSPSSERATVVVDVLSVVLIAATANDTVFQPAKAALSPKTPLVWLNTTGEKQALVAMDGKQDPIILAPNSCHVQQEFTPGTHIYGLKGSTAQFVLSVLS